MSKFNDLTGRIFGELTATKVVLDKYGKRKRWECTCSCGATCTPLSINLIRGFTKSCGCKRRTDLTGKKVGKLTVIEKHKKSVLNKT